MSFAIMSKRPKPAAMTGGQVKHPFARSWTPSSTALSSTAPSSTAPQRLKIGPASHPLEKEADRLADQAMRVGLASVGTATREQVSESVSTDGRDSSLASPTVVNHIDAARQRGGFHLNASLRHVFEPRFNADFGDVRLHTNSQSAEIARAIHARAFTVGRDIFFGRGEYQPSSTSGQHLIAHELAHSLQNARIRHSAASTGVIRRLQSPSTERDPARDRDLVIGWIASIIVTLASGQKLPKDPRTIAEEVLAKALATGGLTVDKKQTTIAQAAEQLSKGDDIGVGRDLLTLIIHQAGLQLSLDDADAVLAAAREAAPLLEAAEGIAPLLGDGLPAELEEIHIEPEDPIEIPATQTEEDTQPCSGEQPCGGERESEADSTAEPETPSMAPAGMAATASKNSKMLEGGIAVLQPAGTTGASTYIAAGSVKLGKKSDAKLKSKLAEEARFGLFACFPDLDPVTAAALIDTNKIVLDVPSADKMRAHGVTEVTVAMDIPNLEKQLSSHSRCSNRMGLVELSNAKTLGQLQVAMDLVSVATNASGPLANQLGRKAIERGGRRAARRKARQAEKALKDKEKAVKKAKPKGGKGEVKGKKNKAKKIEAKKGKEKLEPKESNKGKKAVMRFQVQWGTNQGGPTFALPAVAPWDTGVTTVQATATLAAVLGLVHPTAARTAAALAAAKQQTWILSRPPAGVSGQLSNSEYFRYKRYTDARVDVENLRGHNLRK